MLVFEKGIDLRCREQKAPCVAKFNTGRKYKYIVIGTDYGYIHTTSGDIRTWESYSGAYKAMKKYVGL